MLFLISAELLGQSFFGMLSIILIRDSPCEVLWMLDSVLCSVENLIEVFICVESDVMKLLLVFVFSATSAVSISGSNVNFVATNFVFSFSFLLIKAILFYFLFPANSKGLFSPSFVQTVCIILIGFFVFSASLFCLVFL